MVSILDFNYVPLKPFQIRESKNTLRDILEMGAIYNPGWEGWDLFEGGYVFFWVGGDGFARQGGYS